LKADELFTGDKPPPPPASPAPPIERLLWLAMPLNLMGPFCFTGVPGAILSLWAWYLADEAMAKLDNGALPESFRKSLKTLKSTCFANLLLCMILLILQIIAFSLGIYQLLFQALGLSSTP
jgi:uncharacterized membrane protein SpoIIM required for sporulation